MLFLSFISRCNLCDDVTYVLIHLSVDTICLLQFKMMLNTIPQCLIQFNASYLMCDNLVQFVCYNLVQFVCYNLVQFVCYISK